LYNHLRGQQEEKGMPARERKSSRKTETCLILSKKNAELKQKSPLTVTREGGLVN